MTARAGLLSFPSHCTPPPLTAEICSLGLVAWKRLTACMAKEFLGMSFCSWKALNGTAAFKKLFHTCPSLVFPHRAAVWKEQLYPTRGEGRRALPSLSLQDLWQ